MSNFFDAIEQVYEYIQVSGVTILLDGRIYQHRFPTEDEIIGEGAERFIVINNLEPRNEQNTKTVPVNIQVFCKELQYNLIDQPTLDGIEKAIDTALEEPAPPDKVGYCAIEKVFSHVMPENPYSKKHTLMVIRINAIINTKQ